MKMIGRKHRLVGVRYPVWSSYGPLVLSGIADHMRENESWRIMTENDGYGEMESSKINADWCGDGLILFRATAEELTSFRNRGISVVLTSTEGPDMGFPRVVPDNAMIGKLAARHLMGCGVARFAYLARGETFYQEQEFAPGLRLYARERLAGFRAALAEYSIEPTVHYLRGRPLWKSRTWKEIQAEVMEFLSQLTLPCGLFVADDSLGVVALRAADLLGMNVPGDLAVIGFGNDLACCHASFPPLTSMSWPGGDIGRAAAAQLQRMMDGEAPVEGRIEISVREVVPRESSDTLALDDPEIRELVRHIRATAPNDAMKVSELGDLSQLSLSTIKARFKKHLGHGPKQEIQLVRLQHLTRMLEQDSISLAEISERMNFGSAHEMSRFFLAATGMRPGAYRESIRQGRVTSHGKPPCAVVFDMDGTLFDTEELYFEAYRRAIAAQGGELKREDYFHNLMGRSNAAIERYIAESAGPDFDEIAFGTSWRQQFRSMLDSSSLAPLPGVRNALESLCEAGVALALASSSDMDEIDACLEISGLAPYFPIRASGDEVREGKPDPAIYVLACKRLGLSPSVCVAVEDSTHGQSSAIAAGMRVVRVASRISAKLPDGVCHLHTLDEFSLTDWKSFLGISAEKSGTDIKVRSQ